MKNFILPVQLKKKHVPKCQIIRVSKRSGNMKNGEYKYDNNYDNLDIKVLKPFVHDKTVEIAEVVLLDFGENNSPISLEILETSKMLNISKDSLRNIINFKISISVNDKFISLYCMFNVKVHNKLHHSIF